MTLKPQHELSNSILFALAATLTGLMAFLALSLVFAKQSVERRGVERAFLANKQRALSFYKVFSAAYDFLNPPFYTEEMRNEILQLIGDRPGLHVLDVGCGTGYTTTGILNRTNVSEVIGVDMNPVQLNKAKKKHAHTQKSRAAFSRGDAEKLPFKSESFDAVISVGAIEYFPDPAAALKEIARVTKPGGAVVVGGPELGWFRQFALDKFFYTPSTGEVQGLFRGAGLGGVKSALIGVNTVFGTGRYVFVVEGTKNNPSQADV